MVVFYTYVYVCCFMNEYTLKMLKYKVNSSICEASDLGLGLGIINIVKNKDRKVYFQI